MGCSKRSPGNQKTCGSGRGLSLMAITLTSKNGDRQRSNRMGLHDASSGMKVLIINEDPGARSNLKDCLNSKGHRVYTAFDSDHGVELADKIQPDLIILALELPKMNGYGVSAVLTEQPSMGSIPRIVLSGKRDPEEVVRALNGFADAIIIKPTESSRIRKHAGVQNRRPHHHGPYRRVLRRKRSTRKWSPYSAVRYCIAAFVVLIVSLFVSGIIPNVFVSYNNIDKNLRSQMKIYQPKDVERHLHALPSVNRSLKE